MSDSGNDPNRFITLAIHTPDAAVELKNRLEAEGIEAVLHNVNLQEAVLASGVRVRIRERDLPQALRVVEAPLDSKTAKRSVLLPVDFSDFSLLSCGIGMEYARKIRGKVILLHSYLNERHSLSLPFASDNATTRADKKLTRTAQQKMEDFVAKLQEKIAVGELPKVKIEAVVTEGLPEEQILRYAEKYKVSLIVMGTGGKHSRRQNVIGSVTAEVLDACKFPIFTVPITMGNAKIADLRNVAFFTNLIREDIISMDSFSKLVDFKYLNVTIIPVVEKKERKLVDQSLQQLLTYCREHYPEATFRTKRIGVKNFVDDFASYAEQEKIDLIAIPNKKKSIFSRLFNPSIAHRVLFQTDMPMLVVPIA